MGISIGNSAQRLLPLRSVSQFATANRDGQSSREILFPEQRPEPPKAGFGSGTVSTPSAALRALDRNLENAKDLIPTFAELQQEVRDRIAREQERLTREPAPETPPPGFDYRAATDKAAGLARDRVNSFNETTSAVLTRTPFKAAENEDRFDVRITNKTVPFTAADRQPIFDVFA